MAEPTSRGRRGRVLIGFAESFAAIEAAWSLQQAGFEVIAYSRQGSKPPLRLAPGVTVLPVRSPEVSAAGWIADVDRILDESGIDAYLPLDDAALWIVPRLSGGRHRIVGPPAAAVRFALDKELQVQAAAAAGLAVPPTTIVDATEAVDLDDGPRMVKPADAVRLEGDRLVRPAGRICATRAELRAADADGVRGRLLVQPLVNGTGEGVFSTRGPHGYAPWSAHRRVRMVNPSGSASSACRSIPVDARLQAGIEVMLDQLDWRGLFMGEFLRDEDGTPWFMELNGRAWGSLALARRRGFEYPAWAVEELLDGTSFPPAPADPPEIVCRHAGREIVHLAFVLRGPSSVGVSRWPGRRSTVRELLRFDRRQRFYNFDPRQPRVWWADTTSTVAQQVRRLVTR